MPPSLFADAMAHHVWATQRLIDVCSDLTADQLAAPVPGTYGSIIETLRHLVASDSWYLSFFVDEGITRVDDDPDAGLDKLRRAFTANGALWGPILDRERDPDRRIEEIDGEWRYVTPVGVRLAQVVHHGTDHRSQICTALTGLGMTPPDIDVWAYAEDTRRGSGERIEPGAG